jgi:hypothetical protein
MTVKETKPGAGDRSGLFLLVEYVGRGRTLQAVVNIPMAVSLPGERNAHEQQKIERNRE